jgi:predicted esterase
MSLSSTQNRSFRTTLDCHYLVSPPERAEHAPLLIAALHGFGSNPEVMLRLTRNLIGSGHVLAAVQAPHPFYLTPNQEVGYCWATHRHSEESVRLHHAMLLHVLAELGDEYEIPRARRVLVGFSQPVGLNYRFSATYPEEVGGVIGICGGIPKNWEAGPYRDVTASLLHIARREDEFYKPEVTEHYAQRLRLRARDVEFQLLEGGHRFPSKAGPIVNGWLERVFGGGHDSWNAVAKPQLPASPS